MELRDEPRFQTTEPVRLTVLANPEAELSGQVVNFSGSGLRLMLATPLPHGTAVKVEWEDTVLLGEVCYCQPAGREYAVGLKLEHSLFHTQELARLARTLLGETPAPQPAQEVPKKQITIARLNKRVTP